MGLSGPRMALMDQNCPEGPDGPEGPEWPKMTVASVANIRYVQDSVALYSEAKLDKFDLRR